MTTIFDFIREILYNRTGKLLEDDNTKQIFQPYMVQRWLSMYSPQMAQQLNRTLNRQWQSFEDKDMWYKAFMGMVPKKHFRKINYLKKNKDYKKKEPYVNEIISALATQHQLSKREIKDIIEIHNLDLAKYKNQFK